jgi:hypothetical protein
MSLISLRNFSAPLQSKFQIGILVVLALVVAAIRFSGPSSRSLPSVTGREGSSSGADPRDAEIVDFLKGVEKNRNQAAKRPPADDELQGLMDGSYERDLQRKRDQQQKSGKFDDIRKSLGLE